MELSRIQAALGDRFTLEREVGRGAMAVVYLARDHRQDRDVAIKVLKTELLDSSNADRFLREIRIEGKLQHPHILPIYESGSADQFLYYVMPYVEGETLKDRITREGPLAVEEAIRIGREVADALASAHEHGVLHRDVKPGNILLSGGHAVLSDFGIARALMESAGDRLTSSGIAIGTPMYMSPEQAGGDDRLDERSDIYSLGCVLFEMLAGEPPFIGRTAASILAKHVSEPVPSMAVHRTGLPHELTATVERMLAKVPADRFKNARALVGSLDESLTATAITGHRAVRPKGRFRRGSVLAGLATAAVAALAIWLGPRIVGPEPVLDPGTVVIFPLADRSAGGSDRGLDALIGVAVDQVETLRWRSGWGSLTPEQRLDAGLVMPEDYRAISTALGAGFFVTGQIVKSPESVSVLLLLHDTRGDSIAQQASATAALGVTPDDQVVLQAVGFLIPKLVDPDRTVDLSLITDRVPAAVTNWVQGEREYRLAHFPEALEFYRRAVEEDSMMAVAAYKGAQAANWSHRPDQAPDLIERAQRAADALPARHQLLLRGLDAYWKGRADTAIARLREAVAADPQWSEAWTLLGEVHQHLLPRGASMDSAQAFFSKAAEDPGFTPPLIHLTQQAIREGRTDDAADLLDRLAANGANPTLLTELHEMARCVTDGPDAMDFESAARTDPLLVYTVAKVLSAGALQAPCARAGFEALLTVDAWSTTYSWASAEALQSLYIAGGEAARAERLLTSLIESGGASANPRLVAASRTALFLAVINSIAGAPMPALTAQTVETAHQRYGTGYERILGVNTPWVLGNWHAHVGDVEVVTRLRDHLIREAEQRPDPAEARLYAAALSAHISLLRGDRESAIAQFDALTPVADMKDLQNSFPSSLGPERLQLARLLFARGDYRRAHDVAASFDHPEPQTYLAFIPESLRIRRESALALGDREAVNRYTQRLRALGRDDLIGPGR